MTQPIRNAAPRRSFLDDSALPQYLDAELPRSPPRLHELAHALRNIGVEVPFIRTRVVGDRILACLQLVEKRGGELSGSRVRELARVLTENGFLVTTGERVIAARQMRDEADEPVSGVHFFVAAE